MKLRPEFEGTRSNLMNWESVPSLDTCLNDLLREEQHLLTQTTMEQQRSAYVPVAYAAQGWPYHQGMSYSTPQEIRMAISSRHSILNTVPLTQSAPAHVQPVTLDMIQQMIIFAFSALGLSGKPLSTSSPWYFDSEASHHMTNNAESLTNVNKYFGNLKIHTACGNHLPITATGDVSPSLTDVFVSPGLTTNLVFVGQLVDNNCKVEFSKSGCVVQDQQSRRMIAKGPKVGRLFPLQFPLSSFLTFVSCNSAHVDYRVWHKRLGHPNSNDFLQTHDIISQRSCLSTPQQNGVAERKSRHLLDVVRILLLESSTPSRFLCEALSTAIHLINRLPSPTLNHNSPFTRLFGHPLSYSNLRTFGCVCYVHLHAHEHTKLTAQSIPCAFLGYSVHQKGFLCYDPNLRCIRVSRNAIKHECWRKAVETELLALEENQTWDVVPCPSSVKPHGSKFVFSVKLRFDGFIDRYKARLVALGNKQEYGLDYDETFAPVAKMTIVRTILALAASQSWPLHQMDVKNAFLHGDLKEEVYLKLPSNMPTSSPNDVCKLKRSLYGLKQAPRVWFEKFRSTLLGFSFTQSQYDSSIFIQRTSMGIVVLLVYVDDIVITAFDLKAISAVQTLFHERSWLAHLFLGFRGPSSTLHQHKYSQDLVQLAGLTNTTSVDTPMELNVKYRRDDGELLKDPTTYRKLVGSLIYLTITRPDISYVVHTVNKFMQAPRHHHLSTVCRIIRYILGTPSRGLFFLTSSSLQLQAYSDADWAGCPDIRRSTTGWCMFLGDALISWKCKKQDHVSKSITEAEYRAMSDACSEIIWLRGLLTEFRFSPIHPTPLHADNTSAIQIATNPVYHERTKHIEVDCHSIREAYDHQVITRPHVSTTLQIAEIFTKSMPRQRHHFLVGKLMLVDSPASI
ncbi:unnamed protein product [Prunus armeniaca]